MDKIDKKYTIGQKLPIEEVPLGFKVKFVDGSCNYVGIHLEPAKWKQHKSIVDANICFIYISKKDISNKVSADNWHCKAYINDSPDNYDPELHFAGRLLHYKQVVEIVEFSPEYQKTDQKINYFSFLATCIGIGATLNQITKDANNSALEDGKESALIPD